MGFDRYTVSSTKRKKNNRFYRSDRCKIVEITIKVTEIVENITEYEGRKINNETY